MTAPVVNKKKRIQSDRKHIFAVDGTPDFLELVRALFEIEHYNVTTTNNVPKTFDQIAAGTPDLIIVDLVIGEQQSWDLLEHLHREAATLDIPVILTSTLPGLLNRAQLDSWHYGHHRVIVRPFEIEEILQAVVDLIGPS